VTRPRAELIRQLAAELAPRPRLAGVGVAAAAWLAAGALLVGAATLATGPLRPGLLRQLASEPGFGLDLLLGVLAGGAAVLGLMRLRVPGLALGARAATLGLVAWAAWAAWQLLELWGRTAPPSTLGQRNGCVLEVLLYSLPPLTLALWMARRAAPLERGWTGLLAGLAAGVLPALAMQLACMDDPLHALGLHLAPVLAVAGLGALLGRLALRRL
jgi:hypothetical protein